MRFRILSICHKAPTWIRDGYDEYAKRLSSVCTLELIEIPADKRNPNEKMVSLIKPQQLVIALDINGAYWSTEKLANKISQWQHSGQDVNFLIGGAEGLPADVLKLAHEKWSLSPLTFPHLLVRVMLAEQLYRAYSILQGHPYHK